jgi:hypothetical protein
MSLRTLYEKIGILVENKTFAVLLVVFFLILVSIYGSGMIENKTGTDTYVDRDSETYQDYDHLYKQNFGSETIVVLVESDDVSDAEVLKAIDSFCLHMEGDKDVQQVVSLSTILKSLSYSSLGSYEIPEDDEIDAILETSHGEYLDQLIGQIMPDERHTIIMVQMPGDSETDKKERVLAEIEDVIAWNEFPAGTWTIATGEPAFLISMSEEMTSSLTSMLAAAFVLMIIALLIVFKHVRWPLLPLSAVMVGLIWTFGAMGFLHIPMTMASMAVFPILIGLGADYAIQFHNRAEEELSKGESPREAIVNTVKHTGPSVAIAVTATCLGFVALFISPIPMIQDFGKISLVGVILCYLASIFVLVPLLYMLDRRAEKKGGNVDRHEEDTGFGNVLSTISVSAAKQPLIILLAVVLTIGGLYADELVGVQTDTEKFVPQDMKPLQDFDKLKSITGGSDQLNIIIKADDVTDPEIIQWMDDFSSIEVETYSEVEGSSSIASVISSAYGSIPSEQSTIDTILDSTSSSITESYITTGRSLGVLNLNLKDGLETMQQEDLIESVERDLLWYSPPPGVSVTITGDTSVMTSIIDALTSGRAEMGYLGLAVIFMGMLLIYRSPIKAVIAVVPILMVTGWLGGVMYVLDMEYNPLTATLGSLVIGIGAEFTILMMERYYEERERGFEPLDAMDRAASMVGQAIIASGSTVIFGFSALVASSFPIIQSFGLVTVIAVAFSLLSTLIVLPPIMVNLDSWSSKRQNKIKKPNQVNL